MRASAESPDLSGARADGEQATRIAGEMGLRPLLGRSHLVLGRVGRRAGDAGAWRHLERAAALFAEMEIRFWMGQAEAEMRALEGGFQGLSARPRPVG